MSHEVCWERAVCVKIPERVRQKKDFENPGLTQGPGSGLILMVMG